MSDRHVVFGAFKTPAGAQAAVQRLGQHGFSTGDISMLMSDAAKDHFATIQTNTKGPEGAAVGGVAGGAVGALLAGLTAIVTITIPGVGLFAAGPLIAILAGASAGAAAGGVVGGLIGMGISEHEARLYEDAIKGGGVIVAVSTHDKVRAKAARKLLEDAGALEVNDERGRRVDVAPPPQRLQ